MSSLPMKCTAGFGHGPVLPQGVHGLGRDRPAAGCLPAGAARDALKRARQIGGDQSP